MQLYDMLEADNRRIRARIAEFDAVDRNNSLERNICFERLKEDILQTHEVRKRTFYATLLHYPDAREAVDYVQHLQLQIAGLLDALARKSITTDEWQNLYLTLKEWLLNSVGLEEGKVFAVAKSYLVAEEQQRLIEEMGVESHFLDQNKRIEESTEAEFNNDYIEYKKGHL